MDKNKLYYICVKLWVEIRPHDKNGRISNFLVYLPPWRVLASSRRQQHFIFFSILLLASQNQVYTQKHKTKLIEVAWLLGLWNLKIIAYTHPETLSLNGF